MSNQAEVTQLCALVEKAFRNASEQTDVAKSYAQWKSCATLAGVASLRLGIDGDLYLAASLEGVAIAARRQMAEMIPEMAA